MPNENPETNAGGRAIVIFDQDCGFCCKQVQHWKESTGEHVEYLPANEAEARFPDIPDLHRSLHFLTPGGKRYQGAAAVFRLMACVPGSRGLLLRAYQHVPLFAALAEAGYAFVAKHRGLLSRV